VLLDKNFLVLASFIAAAYHYRYVAKNYMKQIPTIIFLFTAILFGCTIGNQSSWSHKDSWYHEPSVAGLTPWEWKQINFVEVDAAEQKEAQFLLTSSPLTELSKDQSEKFASYFSDSSNLYLVRSVYLNEGTGKFSVYKFNNKLWVYHGSLGHSSAPMKRKALVIALDRVPSEIYVTCSMDE